MSRKQNKTLQVRMNPKLDPRGAWREGRGFRNRADGQSCSDPLPLTSVRRDTHPCCRPRIRLCCSTVWYGDRATHTVRTRDKARTSTLALIFRKTLALLLFLFSNAPLCRPCRSRRGPLYTPKGGGRGRWGGANRQMWRRQLASKRSHSTSAVSLVTARGRAAV